MADKVYEFLEWGKYGYDPNGEFEVLNMLYDIEVPEGYVSPRVQTNCHLNRFLYEFDDKSIQEQIDIMNRLINQNLLFRAVYSGSKSIHMILCVDIEPETIDEYKFLWHFMNKEFELNGADNRCSDNSRLTRRPHIMRNMPLDKVKGSESILEAYQKLGVRVDIKDTNCLVEQKLLALPQNIIKYDWRQNFQTYYRKKEAEEAYRRKELEENLRKYGKQDMDPDKFLRNYSDKHGVVFMDGFKHVAASSLAAAYFKAGFQDVEFLKNWVKNECMDTDKTIWCNLGHLK